MNIVFQHAPSHQIKEKTRILTEVNCVHQIFPLFQYTKVDSSLQSLRISIKIH